jgi:hypothetical protein
VKRLIPLALVFALSGCASLRNADGTINVVRILDDGSWGLSAACWQQWVPADACLFGQDAIAIARGAALRNRETAVLAARQALIDAEAKIPADSRLKPYLDAIIVLLVIRP